jgi:lipopolysaccharide/colanic/teichoic acid biosynthesis glycosyltransferase
MGKRAMDMVVSLAGLIILFPFFVVMAVAIKLDSQGPVFFWHKRVGKAGKLFGLCKFRTMFAGSDKQTGLTIGERDPRVTRFGYYLRKYKLDELPQLFNVLVGSMSLVGPRPEVEKYVNLYTDEQKKVLSVKPGITDYASIEFRNENSILEGKDDPVEFYIKEIMPIKLSLNLAYIQKHSFLTDTIIILKTIQAILKKQDAKRVL